jgi:drug/metabolite transporter (DMT)-like permease
MLTGHPSQVKAVLRGGSPVEIGAGQGVRKPQPAPSRTQLVLGFAAIYLIWGSTYLGIRYAVETIPPLLMMALRHLTAGTLVYAWVRRRGTPAPQLRQWGYAAVTGMFLFVASHGSLAWAEEKVPSGLAALLCATLPLWTVLVARIDGTEKKLGLKAWAGLLLGFSGVALLIGPQALGSRADMLPAFVVLFGALAWTIGTSYSRRVKMPSSTVLSAAMQMICGGTSLLLSAALTGEMSRVHVSSFTGRSVFSLLYLIVFGSIIAFTVYTWLVSVSSPSMLSTYAYVNPVVAVFLGWLLASEKAGLRTLAATAVILAGVALVSRSRKQVETEEELQIILAGEQAMPAD